MALIPLKQSITITRQTGDDSGWGGGTTTQTFDLRCRVDEKTSQVQSQTGAEVTTTAEIMLDGLADVLYSDVITYEDELGRTIKREPINIEPVRMINGKATLTVVYV